MLSELLSHYESDRMGLLICNLLGSKVAQFAELGSQRRYFVIFYYFHDFHDKINSFM
jgi:hypothetical protein